jgi:hypothetical protein
MRCWLACVAVVVLLPPVLAVGVASATPPPTVAGFRADSTAICTTLNTRIERAHSTGNDLPFLRGSLVAGRLYLAAVRNLRTPAAFVVRREELVTAISGELARLGVLINLYAAGKITFAKLLADQAETRLSSTEISLWSRLGVPTCAS